MPETSGFHNYQPLQVNLENIPQTKHDAHGVPYKIPMPQSSDSQGYPSTYTLMTEESQDALLPRYSYGQQQFSQPIQYIVQPRSRYISQIDRDRPVPDYFGLSVFATVCCCWLLGIWAIYESRRTRKLAGEGRYADARKSSRCTLSLIITSIILGVIFTTLFIVIRVVLLKQENEHDKYIYP